MSLEKTAVLGFHNAYVLSSYKRAFQSLGYTVSTSESLPDLVDLLTKHRYDWCFMDTNLGEPNGLTVEPARRVYELTKSRCQFMSATANDNTLMLAQQAGIPAVHKLDMSSFYCKL